MRIKSWGKCAVATGWILGALPAAAATVTGIPRIVDGDTVQIEQTKIRLAGIDAPETDQLCLDAKGAKWTCGISSRDELIKFSAGRPWTCRTVGMDRYGRSLGKCEVGGVDVERWMVRSGLALSFIRYSHDYDVDEKAARATKAGVWAGSFIAPWDWRSRNKQTVVLGAAVVPVDAQKILLGAASAAEAPDAGCVIKGNVTRSGVCIYHEPGGPWYAKVKMDLSKGNRWYCSTAEAEAAGCRAPKG